MISDKGDNHTKVVCSSDAISSWSTRRHQGITAIPASCGQHCWEMVAVSTSVIVSFPLLF